MGRANNFDGLRLLAAVSVIFSHAFLLTQGKQDNDPLIVLTGGQCILGLVGVFAFFVISGFLVAHSFESTGAPLRFLVKRGLRIFPGLFACIILCAFVLGAAVTELSLSAYFSDGALYDFVLSNFVLNIEHNALPGVRFSGWPTGGIVNGPLWSLPCEAVMYLLVFALGSLRLLRVRYLVPLFVTGLLCIWFDTASSEYFVGSVGWLLAFFVAGAMLYRLRFTGIFDGRIALLALLGLAASVPLHAFILLFPVFGAYLVIFLAFWSRIPALPAAGLGDLSYGLYIYGWPVEQALIYAGNGRLTWWQVFVFALAIAATLAFLSWHLVEKPALGLKPRNISPAPDGSFAAPGAVRPLPPTAQG